MDWELNLLQLVQYVQCNTEFPHLSKRLLADGISMPAVIRPSRHLAPVSFRHADSLKHCTQPYCSDAYHDKALLRWAHLITPSLDERRAKRAFDKLVERHDSLRLKFESENGEWRAHVLPKHPSGIVIEEYGDVNDEAFEAIVNERARSTADAASGA